MAMYMVMGLVLTAIFSVANAGDAELCYRGMYQTYNYCEHGCCGSDNDACCPNTAAIIGGVLGGLAGIVVFVALICCCCRYMSRRQQPGQTIVTRPMQGQVMTTTGASGTYPAYGQPMGAYPANQPMGAYPKAQPMYPSTPMGGENVQEAQPDYAILSR